MEEDIGDTASREHDPVMSLLESAWGVIANAGWNGGAKSPGWQDAAVAWRDRFLAAMKKANRMITVGEDAMPMALHFDDADPVAQCYVRIRASGARCGWHHHGDSMRDAAAAWISHLAASHKQDWAD
jgi:hypothetical protein